MRIRKYAHEDLAATVAVINRCGRAKTMEEFDYGLDEPGERVRENTFVAEDGGKIVGYSNLCFVESDERVQVYSYGCVDPAFRRQGIGTSLYTFILSHLEQSVKDEVRPVTFFQIVQLSTPGHREVVERQGLEPVSDLYRMRFAGDLSDGVTLPTGYVIRNPRQDEASAYAEIYNEAFSWRLEPTPVTADSVRHELLGKSFVSSLHPVLIDPNGHPVGYVNCGIGSPDEMGVVTGHISTVAISPSLRGRGLGKAMVQEALRRLLMHGVRAITLSVEADNPTPAYAIYQKLGFEVVDRYIKFRKIICSGDRPVYRLTE